MPDLDSHPSRDTAKGDLIPPDPSPSWAGDDRLSPEEIAILRRMTPAQRIQAAMSLYETARQMKAAGFRLAHPDWSEEKVSDEVRKAFLRAPGG